MCVGEWDRFGCQRRRRDEPANENSGRESAEELCHDEARHIGWTNPGEGVGELTRECYRRVREGRGSRKPVRAGDVEADGRWHRLGLQAGTASDHAKQAEGCHELAEELSPPVRACCETWINASPNITCAAPTPAKAPVTCASIYAGASFQVMPPWNASARVTAGLKCAPEMGSECENQGD